MKDNKGFTLVELLAVIAILGLLVIIALPNIVEMFNEAKKNSFASELKQIYKAAEQQWMTDSMFETNVKTYARCKNNNCPNQLKLSGRDEIDYFIKLNKNGDIVEYYATDGTYQYSYKGSGIKIEEINDVTQIAKITNGKYVTVTCSNGKVASPEPPSRDYYLMQGTNTQEDTNYLRTTILKKDIEKITFTDSIDGHSLSDERCWDVSYGNNGSVLAWANDNDNNGLYELTIGSNGDVYAYSGWQLFSYLKNLKSFEGMEYFNTSKVNNMYYMFNRSEKIESLDLSFFDTSSVTTMDGMFIYCSSLKSVDLSGFDTSKVTTFSVMFYGCKDLVSVNFKNIDTSGVTSFFQMFSNCESLTSLDISGFNTSNVNKMNQMFSGCKSLTSLDLSNFDTSKVTDTYFMFNQCTNLKTIYVSDSFTTSNVTSSAYMFYGNTKLVGGQGTTFNSSHLDKEYARIDGGTSNPGYFTRK